MSYNVTQDNVCLVLDVQRLFSGHARLKASFSQQWAVAMPTEAVPAAVPAWHGPRVSSRCFKGIKEQCGGAL